MSRRVSLSTCPTSASPQDFPREYSSYRAMRNRCHNPRHSRYPYYGGRGISICERWLKFENFLADMGERPQGKSLDRINNDGNYTPKNCRWATQREQVQNSSNCKLSDKDVMRIRHLQRATNITHALLAEVFGVSRPAISNIVAGRKREDEARG
jgi:predicted XRE-type DNA-binding protein